eukprot:768746-Hanusia_phi.AAC.8
MSKRALVVQRLTCAWYASAFVLQRRVNEEYEDDGELEAHAPFQVIWATESTVNEENHVLDNKE